MALERIVSYDLSGCKSESMSYIIEHVLIRMDVTNLIRYKSVCKSWNDFIAERGFIKAHLKHHYDNKIYRGKFSLMIDLILHVHGF